MNKGWQVIPIGSLGKLFNGNSINEEEKIRKYSNLEEGYPFIATKDILVNGCVVYENGIKIPFDTQFKIAHKNAVLICAEGGSAGKKISITDRDVCFGNKLFAIEANNSIILPRLLFYYFFTNKFRKDFLANLVGIIGGVSQKKFSNIRVIVPPHQEQQRIAEKLDNIFVKIDSIIVNAEKDLNEAQSLYMSFLEHLTKPCDTWANYALGDVVDFVRGPFGGSLTKNMFVESGYAVYEQQHAIHEHLLFRYYVDEKKYNEMERFQVHSGDLIMSCSGVTLGRVVIIPENAPNGIINQALLKMSIRKELINEYLCYLLKSPSFQKTIFEHTKGAAIPNLAPVAIIKKIRVYLPSLEEQRLIVDKLDRINERIQRLKNTIDIIHTECSALKQSILRRAFSGEL